jgi:hypothetical protein
MGRTFPMNNVIKYQRMRNPTMKHLHLALFFVLALLTNISHAVRLPSYYPANGFTYMGIVDGVNLKQHTVIVNDMSYAMADYVQVHSMSEQYDSLARVREGVEIGFSKTTGGNGRGMITEIWLLPTGYIDPDTQLTP